MSAQPFHTSIRHLQIQRIFFVEKEAHPEKNSHFGTELTANELIFHFSGRAKVLFGNQSLETRENTVRFLPQGKIARYDVEREEHGTCIDIAFCTDKPLCDNAFVMDAQHNRQLPALFKKACILWTKKGPAYEWECLSLLYRILAEIQQSGYCPSQTEQILQPAIETIEHRFFSRRIDTEELARQCGVSYSYFRRLFLRQFGQSPRQYIIQLKLNYACELLGTGRYTVTQVADMCGFSDVYFFSRQFKEHMGVSPGQFRQNGGLVAKG